MEGIKDGGPAFPGYLKGTIISGDGKYSQEIIYTPHNGMTLRDWFAGQALTGIILNEAETNFSDAYDAAATLSYKLADAMLRAREGK